MMMVSGAEKKFRYDFGGIDGYTPLHIASQYGRTECIQELLKKEFSLKPDIRNIDGLMALDMISCKEVKKTYARYYKD